MQNNINDNDNKNDNGNDNENAAVPLRYKLISCEVFTREVCIATVESPNIIDLEFTPKGSHNEPKELREEIQSAIFRAENSKHCRYDAILLGFGLCGNSLAEISACKLPLVIPRAHDCCTIFLGSKSSFMSNFGDKLSSNWSSEGYLERGSTLLAGNEETHPDIAMFTNEYRDLVEKYGEDNAKYIWEMLHPLNKNDYTFISTPELKHMNLFEKYGNSIGEYEELRLIEGNMRLLRILVNTNWLKRDENGIPPHQDEFLYIEPGKKIEPVYDMEVIMKAR